MISANKNVSVFSKKVLRTKREVSNFLLSVNPKNWDHESYIVIIFKNIWEDYLAGSRMYNKYIGEVDRCVENVSSMRVAIRDKKWWCPLLASDIDAACPGTTLIQRQSGNNWTNCNFCKNVSTIYLHKYGKDPTQHSASNVPIHITVPNPLKSTGKIDYHKRIN